MLTPTEELKKRVEILQQHLRKNNFSGVIINDYINLYYYSGTAQKGLLLTGTSGNPLLLIKRNVARAREETPWEVREWPGSSALPGILKELSADEGKLGMELDVLPYNEFRHYSKVFGRDPEDFSALIKEQRMLKSPYELSLIKEAQEKHDKIFGAAVGFIKEGMPEIELAAAVEAFSRKQGHQGFVPFHGFNEVIFYGHIMSGRWAAVPSSADSPTGGWGITPVFPQGASLNPIEKNTPVLLDYVGRYQSYLVDQTRIYCIGALTEQLTRAYDLALQIQDEVISRAKPGVRAGELYQLALDMAAKGGFSDNFMGCGQPVAFVGHGIGLELNEMPVLARGNETVLEEGMVFALEPKFIFPGQGVVGIENTIAVNHWGSEKLGDFQEEIIYL